MMGSSLVLAASRQSFAFARDGALPLSKFLYRVNTYTGTPVNTVWFDCVLALLIGLLALLGRAAVSAVFTISVTATYVEYITPIVSRFVFENDFKPGPFSLGVFVSSALRPCVEGGRTLTWIYGRVPRSRPSPSHLCFSCSSFSVSRPLPIQT